MGVRLPPPRDGSVQPKRLSVIVRELSPERRPRPGERVTVILDGDIEVPGRVLQILAWDTVRVEL